MNYLVKQDVPYILTAKDIAEILNISKPKAYALMKTADFPLIQIGRSMRVMRDEFFIWFHSIQNQ